MTPSEWPVTRITPLSLAGSCPGAYAPPTVGSLEESIFGAKFGRDASPWLLTSLTCPQVKADT